MYFLEGTTPTVQAVLSDAGEVTTSVLSQGTKIFNWAMSNPVFIIGLGVALLFTGIGVVKKFTNN